MPFRLSGGGWLWADSMKWLEMWWLKGILLITFWTGGEFVDGGDSRRGAEAQSSQRDSSICHGRGSPCFSRVASEIGKDCLCSLCVLGVLCGRFFGNACSFHLPQRAQSSQRDSESGECRNVGAGFATAIVSGKWIGPDSPNSGLDHGFGHTHPHRQVENATASPAASAGGSPDGVGEDSRRGAEAQRGLAVGGFNEVVGNTVVEGCCVAVGMRKYSCAQITKSVMWSQIQCRH